MFELGNKISSGYMCYLKFGFHSGFFVCLWYIKGICLHFITHCPLLSAFST
uniref:Uncharacterized protein n=1 Tax=Anguilla anguilla TaxID=7936 RepID=A0A0E9T3B5_ANGAN